MCTNTYMIPGRICRYVRDVRYAPAPRSQKASNKLKLLNGGNYSTLEITQRTLEITQRWRLSNFVLVADGGNSGVEGDGR